MSDRAAPRVFISYAHDSAEHDEQVRHFATFLRTHVGLNAHVDRWYQNVRRDWSMWATEHLADADFILVIASPQYKRQADGLAAPDEGRDSQFQAAIIRDNLTKNLRQGTERILPVVLPGRSVSDIPTFLNPYAATSFHVDEFTYEGVSVLLAAITGHGRHPLPELGKWRGGADSVPERPALLTGMRWLISSPDIQPGSAQINGVRYADSIISPPTSSSTVDGSAFVEVDLDGAYRRMTSVAGVLDNAGEPFQVGHFKIHLDGSLRWESKAALGKPVTVDLNTTGARKLRLEMYRWNPWIPGALTAGRPPELAWGNPALS
jgi:hypothetical protein